jgi:hypothetical protein
LTTVTPAYQLTLSAIAAYTLLLSACDTEVGTTGWTAQVDTVATTVRVVDTPPAGVIGPTLIGQEELRVGTMEGAGPTSFGSLRELAVLRDGRFAVADAQSEEVRLFDRDGTHLRTLGGAGAGPGELQGLQGVYVDHEGFLRVAEQRNGRLSVFDPDAGFLTSYPLQLYSYRGRGPWNAAMDPAGRTLVASSGQYGEGRYWNMVRVYDPTMTQIDSIPYYDYTDDVNREDFPGAWLISLGNGRMFMGVPFYALPVEVLTASGEFWSSRDGASHLEVARWRPAGDTSLVIMSMREPDLVTPAERDSAMADVRARLAERMAGPPSLSPSKIPASKTPLHALSFDDRGRIWARVGDADARTSTYDVFDPEGIHAETVELPFQADLWIPPVVRGDELWAVVTDDMDVQFVVRARLRVAPGTLP